MTCDLPSTPAARLAFIAALVSASDPLCDGCGASDHAEDSKFCRRCGTELVGGMGVITPEHARRLLETATVDDMVD